MKFQPKLEDVEVVEHSSLTIRGYRRRTTVPAKVCKLLKLKDKDQLKWILLKDRTVLVTKTKK